jgi:hypothetical protein
MRRPTSELVDGLAILGKGHHIVVNLSSHAVPNTSSTEGLEPVGENGGIVVLTPIQEGSSDYSGQRKVSLRSVA